MDGTKIYHWVTTDEILNDNLKLSLLVTQEKQIDGYDSWDDANANADNIMYVLQSNLETKRDKIEDKFSAHIHVHDRYYDTAVKNKYSQSFNLKVRKLDFSEKISLGFGADYNYNKGDFEVKGN